MVHILRTFIAAIVLTAASGCATRQPIPEKLVVLTFDDGVVSHYTVVRPILKDYGFRATFFITEGLGFADDKNVFMTWDQIAELHRDGFEIGNHTRDHIALTTENIDKLERQIEFIESRCKEHGMIPPVTFAYPGNVIHPDALPILRKNGILFARRGGEPEYPYEDGRGVAYEPGCDHPLLIPSAGDARPDWTLDDFKRAVHQAGNGRIVVLQFHGVPEYKHPWVHTPPEKFEQYMQYLHDEGYSVIAMRDLERYVDPNEVPADPFAIMEQRRATNIQLLRR
jgi:peptidoglycan/xylan/chitin deacetylase (PgdA/CDA1 family)